MLGITCHWKKCGHNPLDDRSFNTLRVTIKCKRILYSMQGLRAHTLGREIVKGDPHPGVRNYTSLEKVWPQPTG